MKARKLLCQGCIRYWSYAIDTQLKGEKAGNILIICEFEDVFLKELPGLPPQRKINFGIELIPDAQPIPNAPYRMAPTKLKKLKIQLDELLQKGLLG